MQKLKFPIITLLVFLGLTASPSLYAQHYAHAPKEFLLSPTYQIRDNPYFDWVLLQRDHGSAFEQAKIEYLIERIRTSPYLFVRNDEAHNAKEAAEHLSWKYHKAEKLIRTARDFITHIATRSIMSGKLYFIKLKDGHSYPASEVLDNELNVLENQLTNQSANPKDSTAPALQ